MQFAIWMMTSLPRLRILLVSACHTPAVAVFMPVPRPAMTRPTIIWATLKLLVNGRSDGNHGAAQHEDSGTAEDVTGQMVDRAPKKQPRL